MTSRRRPTNRLWPRDDPCVARRPHAALRVAFRVPSVLYRWNLGWLLGHRFLLLEHTGRRTGAQYQTVLEVLTYAPGSRESTVLSGWGRSADWYRNVEARAPNNITIGRETFAASHEVLDEQEAASVLAEYEAHNRWLSPIIRRVLGALAGTRYDGSDESRRSLVRRLPIVRFTAVD